MLASHRLTGTANIAYGNINNSSPASCQCLSCHGGHVHTKFRPASIRRISLSSSIDLGRWPLDSSPLHLARSKTRLNRSVTVPQSKDFCRLEINQVVRGFESP